jgi:hypothetical protein
MAFCASCGRFLAPTAVSVASVLVLTEAALTEVREREPPEPTPPIREAARYIHDRTTGRAAGPHTTPETREIAAPVVPILHRAAHRRSSLGEEMARCSISRVASARGPGE